MSFSVYLGWWLLPTIVSVYCLLKIFGPAKMRGYDSWGVGAAVDAFVRVLWVIPLGVAWIVYLVLALWLGIR